MSADMNGWAHFREAIARTNDPRQKQVFHRASSVIFDAPVKKKTPNERVAAAVQERNALGHFVKKD